MSRTRDSIAKQALEAIASGSGMYGVDRKDDLDWAMNEACRALAAMEKTPVSGPVAETTWKDDWRPPQSLDWEHMSMTRDSEQADDRHHRYTIGRDETGYVLRRRAHSSMSSTVLNVSKSKEDLKEFADDMRAEESKP